MKRSDILDTSKVSSYITEEKANHKFIEVGHIRRAKMHVSCLIEDIDNKNALTPALRTLLEASLILQTTSAKVLAAHLHRPPATIRAEFQQILSVLGNRIRDSESRTTEYEGFLFKKDSNG